MGAKSDLEKANVLNEHFVNTGDWIQSVMSTDNTVDPDFFSQQMLPPAFEFVDVNLENVLDAITKVSASKSASLDGITSYVLNAQGQLSGPFPD